MTQRGKAVKYLKAHGYILKRAGANHDIFYNPLTKHTIPLKRGHFDEDDLRYIMKEVNQGR